MTAPVRPFASVVDTLGPVSPDSAGACGKVFPKVFPTVILDRVWRGVPVQPAAYRDQFPRRWARFLRATLPSAEAVAVALQIDERTARNHWDGLHRPTGDRVAMLACVFPEEFRRFCGTGGAE